MKTKQHQDIVILTGAGISKESGIDTFRDEDGIWSKVSLEDVATPEGFQRDRPRVLAFYDDRREQLLCEGVEPNAAHHALARLEAEWSSSVLVITQNIDDLHERAGQKNLVHMHGELLKARCESCKAVHQWTRSIPTDSECPSCNDGARLRPHVVWFGEMPLEMERIEGALKRCRLFISIGTSGAVYPAAGFVMMARRYSKAHTVELNLEASEGSSFFREHHYGPASRVVPAYVNRLLDGGLVP